MNGLFFKGLIFGGAYIRWEICVAKSIGLANSWEANKKNCVTASFWLCFILYLRAISKYKAPGVYIRRGDLIEGFFALRVWGAYIYMEGLIFGI